VFWIWLFTRNNVNWSTGLMTHYFAFQCGDCGTYLPAMVHTSGFSAGSNRFEAERSAHAVANANATHAVAAAACPDCGRLPRASLDALDRAAKRVARRARLRAPIAAGLALAVLVGLGIPAAFDLRHSPSLAGVALFTAVAAGALVFAILSTTVSAPRTDPSGVWFSRDPSRAHASWFPASPGSAPAIVQPSRASRVLAFVMMAAASIAGVVALFVWLRTYRKVYVVSSEARGDLLVQIDGAASVRVTPDENTSADVSYALFEVRTSSSHRVTVVDADGGELAYDLDPASSDKGWIVAPHASERGLCLADVTVHYGNRAGPDEIMLLNRQSDLVVLQKSFTHVFTQPPNEIQTRSSSETRTSLRGLDCASLQNGEYIQHRRVSARRAPTLL
jgi:hypothetical protein